MIYHYSELQSTKGNDKIPKSLI